MGSALVPYTITPPSNPVTEIVTSPNTASVVARNECVKRSLTKNTTCSTFGACIVLTIQPDTRRKNSPPSKSPYIQVAAAAKNACASTSARFGRVRCSALSPLESPANAPSTPTTRRTSSISFHDTLGTHFFKGSILIIEYTTKSAIGKWTKMGWILYVMLFL